MGGWVGKTRVSPAEVGVQVKGATVTLTGVVDSWAKRKAAEQAAHRVSGVFDIANDLDVRLAGSGERTDTDIAQTVRSTLEWNVMVPDKQIRSTVSKGYVTLEGEVALWSQRVDAERAVDRLAGVRSVVNKIQLKPPAVDSAELRGAVQKALERQADREASRIDLRADDGIVQVTGVVHAWAEKDAVLGAVRGTRGVRNVEDHLTIQPYA